MYFLCNSCVSGQYIASNIAIHRSNIETPLRVERFGDSVVQFSNWENFIEVLDMPSTLKLIVMRIVGCNY